RCALDKPYLTDLSNMSDVVKKTDTKNYKLTLQGKGVIASSKGNYNYNLQMPSYADGRICCDGPDCAKLNKNYPSCTGFTYEESPDSCAGTVTPVEPEIKSCSGSSTQACGCLNKGTQSRTCNTTTGVWSDWGACSVSDECECTGNATQACGCLNKGTQSRTCNTTTGEWSNWGACSVSNECECAGEKKDRQVCTTENTCGFETRTATCDASTGEWKYGAWNQDGCLAVPQIIGQPCSSCGGVQLFEYICRTDSGSWEKIVGECDKPEEECEEEKIVTVCTAVGQACTRAGYRGSCIQIKSNLCCEIFDVQGAHIPTCYSLFSGSGGGTTVPGGGNTSIGNGGNFYQ
ncbi:MAG: hypothetical protein ACI37O_05935, partial [Candidatus Avelusimicrobium sp.]